jgi:hypothetical protein
MKYLLFIFICLSCTSSHAAYELCGGFKYPNDESSPPCVMNKDFSYYYQPNIWKDEIYEAYCTVTATDNPLDPSGLKPGAFTLAPLDGDNWYSVPSYTFGGSDYVPDRVTYNVMVTNLVVNPGEMFGIFTIDPNAVLLVNCNTPR